MSNYRTRNQTLLAVAESPSGTEGAPTTTANAIKVKHPVKFGAEPENLETDYVQESISKSEHIVGGKFGTLEFGGHLRGAGTAGQAPAEGVLYRGCAMSQTLTAADVTGTAQAGSTGSITLHAGASAVDQAYKGMVLDTTGGTGSGQTVVITNYVGGTKVATIAPVFAPAPDATTTFAIRANALYKPITVSQETLTLWRYQHRNNPAENSRRSRVFGALGNMQIALKNRAFADINFNFRGIVPAKPDDVAKPAAAVYVNSPAPEKFATAKAYIGAAQVKFEEFSFDLGNELDQGEDPGAAEGWDLAQAVDRVSQGRIKPHKQLISAFDPWGDWETMTDRSLWLRWGSAAGKRVSILCPKIRYNGHEDDEIRKFLADGLPFRAWDPDAEIYMCIH